jgi:hypothetical protein
MEQTTDAAKQDRQKTVVAFVAGLLIGGLLAWVFSSSPANAPVDDHDHAMEGDESSDVLEDHADDATESTGVMDTPDAADASGRAETAVIEPVGGAASPSNTDGVRGTLVVNDQDAGAVVVLADVSFPTTAGWVVVRDYANDVAGNILGAARFDTQVGLLPSEVPLLRETEAGATYRVAFHSEDGDLEFNSDTDTELGGATTFFVAR